MKYKKFFSASELYSISIFDGFKDPPIHFLHFEKNIYKN